MSLAVLKKIIICTPSLDNLRTFWFLEKTVLYKKELVKKYTFNLDLDNLRTKEIRCNENNIGLKSSLSNNWSRIQSFRFVSKIFQEFLPQIHSFLSQHDNSKGKSFRIWIFVISMHPSGLLPELELGISAEHMKNDHHSARLMKMKWELVAYDIYRGC